MTSADDPQDPNAWLPPAGSPGYGPAYPPGQGPGYAPGAPQPPQYGWGPAGYPPPYGYGAPWPPPASAYPQPGPGRPGVVLASAVLGYILSGLAILGGIYAAVLAAIIHGITDQDYFYFHQDFLGRSHLTTELTVDAVISLVVGATVLTGSVLITAPGTSGRTVLTAGCVLCVSDALYWIAWLRSDVLATALLFIGLAALSTVFAWTPAAAKWFASKRVKTTQPG